MENASRSWLVRHTVRVARRDVVLEVSRWFPLSLLATWAVVLGSFTYVDRILASGWTPAEMVLSSVVSTLLLLATVVVHEAGHVVAAELVGHRWVLARFGGWGVSVGLDPDNPRGWDRITRSIAGPGAQIVCSAPLALTILLEPIFRDPPVVMPFQYLTLWFPGMLGLGIGLANLLPVPGFDGAKVASGVRDLWDARRSQ
jgi:Zn-dependent protease